MKLCVEKTEKLRGVVAVPGSKSYTHRALIASSLSGKARIIKPLISADTLSTKEACEAFGAVIEERDRDWIVEGVKGELDLERDVIDSGNSGTTFRFITALSALSAREVTVTGDESIQKRPIKPLLDALKDIAEIKDSNGFAPLRIKSKGKIINSTVEIRGDVSSQYISGLLLTAPLVGLDIKLTSELKSRPYVDITLDVLRQAGVKVDVRGDGFTVEKQEYRDTEYRIPGDYSTAANILCPCAFIDSDVEVKNLDRGDKQGDRKILDILEDMGADIERGKDSVRIKNAEGLKPLEVDVTDIPDLVLPLVAVCCFADGKSVIKNAGHLRYKESDRLNACNEFSKLGADVKVREDEITVNGPTEIKAAELKGFSDHRVVMALASAAMKTEKGVSRIDSADMLNISFPKYLESMRNLGANMRTER